MAREIILVVDPTPVNLKLTRMTLLRDGYTVVTAGSTDEAVAALRSNHPRVMLVFLQAGVDALVLARGAKQDPQGRVFSVVVAKLATMPAAEQETLRTWCDSLLPAPADAKVLLERVREYTAPGAGAAAAPKEKNTAALGSLASAKCTLCGGHDTRPSLERPLMHRLFGFGKETYRCRACRHLFLVPIKREAVQE